MSLEPPIRVLSIDGGGIRGLSSLIILRVLMLRVAKHADPRAITPALPHEYFDLIIGTGTGGLIALMLGRLCMPIDECIARYRSLATTVFRHKSQLRRWIRPKFNGKALYSAKKLEKAIKTFALDAKLRDGPESSTRTCVVATREISASSTPQLFRSYDAGGIGNVDDCAVWEAGRATTAMPLFFKPITVKNVSYIDAAMGTHNNPAELALEEVSAIWPNSQVELLLSIGTGAQKPINVSVAKSRMYPRLTPKFQTRTCLAKALGLLVASCDGPHHRLQVESNRSPSSSPYFRFNVERGLQDVIFDEWTEYGIVYAHTEAYLQEPDHQPNITACVNRILGHSSSRLYVLSSLFPKLVRSFNRSHDCTAFRSPTT